MLWSVTMVTYWCSRYTSSAISSRCTLNTHEGLLFNKKCVLCVLCVFLILRYMLQLLDVVSDHSPFLPWIHQLLAFLFVPAPPMDMSIPTIPMWKELNIFKVSFIDNTEANANLLWSIRFVIVATGLLQSICPAWLHLAVVRPRIVRPYNARVWLHINDISPSS